MFKKVWIGNRHTRDFDGIRQWFENCCPPLKLYIGLPESVSSYSTGELISLDGVGVYVLECDEKHGKQTIFKG